MDLEIQLAELQNQVQRLKTENERLKSVIDAQKRQYNALVTDTDRKLGEGRNCVDQAAEQVVAANARAKFWESQGRMANDLAERTRRDVQVLQLSHDRLLQEKYLREADALGQESVLRDVVEPVARPDFKLPNFTLAK